jgi:hypothetical protein
MRVGRLKTNELKRLTDKLPFTLHWVSTRAEVELGLELETVLRDGMERVEEQCVDSFFPLELPKLDIIAIAFAHQASGELVVIHEDHYSEPFYWHSARHRHVPLSHALGRGTIQTVFQCDQETPRSSLLFFHMQYLLHLFAAQNRLWYTLLAEGFYAMPGRIHGWQHEKPQ